MKQHRYDVQVSWTGNMGQGTRTYKGYLRDHEIAVPGKPVLPGSSDPTFRGDASRYNPEELLVASLSTCHMLWYLHLCADNGVVVESYSDRATGIMAEDADGAGVFTEVTLHPEVMISADSDEKMALSLHDEAHHRCFIANSVKFPVKNSPRIGKAAQSNQYA